MHFDGLKSPKLSRNTFVRNVWRVRVWSLILADSGYPKSMWTIVLRASLKRFKNNGFSDFRPPWSASVEAILSRNAFVRNVWRVPVWSLLFDDSGYPKSMRIRISRASLRRFKNNGFRAFLQSWSAAGEAILSRNAFVRNVWRVTFWSLTLPVSGYFKSMPIRISWAWLRRCKNNVVNDFWLSWSASVEAISSRNALACNFWYIPVWISRAIRISRASLRGFFEIQVSAKFGPVEVSLATPFRHGMCTWRFVSF